MQHFLTIDLGLTAKIHHGGPGCESSFWKMQKLSKISTSEMAPFFGGNTILPMHWDLPDDGNGNPWCDCDLKHVQINLVRGGASSNTNITLGFFFICMAAVSCAKGDKGKFVKTIDWTFDPFLRILNTPWPDIKTHQSYAVPQLPSEDWFAVFSFMTKHWQNLFFRTR